MEILEQDEEKILMWFNTLDEGCAEIRQKLTQVVFNRLYRMTAHLLFTNAEQKTKHHLESTILETTSEIMVDFGKYLPPVFEEGDPQ